MCVRPLYYAPMCERSSAEKRRRDCFVSWVVVRNSLGHCITTSSPPLFSSYFGRVTLNRGLSVCSW